jgi:hypothetical protein
MEGEMHADRGTSSFSYPLRDGVTLLYEGKDTPSPTSAVSCPILEFLNGKFTPHFMDSQSLGKI